MSTYILEVLLTDRVELTTVYSTYTYATEFAKTTAHPYYPVHIYGLNGYNEVIYRSTVYGHSGKVY